MKKILLITSIFILVGLPFHVGSINYRNKEITLISFGITINPETKSYLDQFESYFPSLKNNSGDKIIAKIKEQAWGSIVDILQKDIGMIILPIRTYGNNINYDAYGFPDVNIGKAQRKGFSKFYMKIDIQIGPETYHPLSSFKADTLDIQTKLKNGEIKPMVTITFTSFPESGIIPIDKHIGIAIAPEVWPDDDASVLDGLVNTSSKDDLSTLMSLINEAINDLSINILVE